MVKKPPKMKKKVVIYLEDSKKSITFALSNSKWGKFWRYKGNETVESWASARTHGNHFEAGQLSTFIFSQIQSYEKFSWVL